MHKGPPFEMMENDRNQRQTFLQSRKSEKQWRPNIYSLEHGRNILTCPQVLHHPRKFPIVSFSSYFEVIEMNKG
jgi:hypothetical protein